MSWFGRKKSAQAPSSVKSKQPMTIVQLRESLSTQEKLEEQIQREIDAMVEEAKTKKAKNDKKGALSALKRKKRLETELDKIQNEKWVLETQVMSLEAATHNAQMFQPIGCRIGDGAIVRIRKQIEVANENSNTIGQSSDALTADDDDDDELLEALNMLSLANPEQEMLTTPARKDDLKLPTVPNAEPPALAREEEDELKKLEAELAQIT